MPSQQTAPFRIIGLVIFVAIVAIFMRRMKNASSPPASPPFSFNQQNPPSTPPAVNNAGPTTNPVAIASIAQQLQVPTGIQAKDGIAAAILIDTSGSMAENVRDSSGRNSRKLDIARRCVSNVVRQCVGFAKDQPSQPLMLAMYEFSGRGNSNVRCILKPATPDLAAADKVLRSLRSDGGTPIGEAIIQAKKDLDRTGLSRTHILVVTDGQNTVGPNPADVVWAISRLPDDSRPAVYFIAFDVAADVFNPVKEGGALILPAADEAQLQQTLDFVMGNKILLEK